MPECRGDIARTFVGPGRAERSPCFLSYFADLPDSRQAGKVIYPLQEVLLVCLLAVLAGAENFVDIARFGAMKIELLRRFLPFKDGTPSHDQLCDIFAMIDATHFQRCFVAWVAKMLGGVASIRPAAASGGGRRSAPSDHSPDTAPAPGSYNACLRARTTRC
jgi:hypothetical protein